MQKRAITYKGDEDDEKYVIIYFSKRIFPNKRTTLEFCWKHLVIAMFSFFSLKF